MTVWIIIVNIILLVSAAGTIPVWIQMAKFSSSLALILCFTTLVIAMVTSLFIVRKFTISRKKHYLLFLLIPVVMFLSIIIFKDGIIGFLSDIMMPIGPGGMVISPENMK